MAPAEVSRSDAPPDVSVGSRLTLATPTNYVASMTAPPPLSTIAGLSSDTNAKAAYADLTRLHS